VVLSLSPNNREDKGGQNQSNYRKAIADYDMAIQLADKDYKSDFKYRNEAVAALAKAEGP
jgi:hypothetical protein